MWIKKAVADDCRKRNKVKSVIGANQDYVKGGEFGRKNRGLLDNDVANKKENSTWFIKGKFKKFLQRYLHKNVLKFKLFGKTITLVHPVPNYFRDRIVAKLTKKYLDRNDENSQFNRVIKLKNEIEIKKLAKPIKRDLHGKPVNVKQVKNGSFMRCYESQFEGYDIKRYESLRVICDDIRKTLDENAAKIDAASIPLTQDGL